MATHCCPSFPCPICHSARWWNAPTTVPFQPTSTEPHSSPSSFDQLLRGEVTAEDYVSALRAQNKKIKRAIPKFRKLIEEHRRYAEALNEIQRLPCQYPDDPEADRRMALDSVKAQEIAFEALNPHA